MKHAKNLDVDIKSGATDLYGQYKYTALSILTSHRWVFAGEIFEILTKLIVCKVARTIIYKIVQEFLFIFN